MKSPEILEQAGYLEFLEHDLADLIAGRTPAGSERVVRAIIRDGLASVREAISVRNSYWENSEKLKELERRFSAFAYGEIHGQTLTEIVNLYADGGWLEEVKDDLLLEESEAEIFARTTGNYGPHILDKIPNGYLELLVEQRLVEAEDWTSVFDLPHKKVRRFSLTNEGRRLGRMSEDQARMYFAKVGIWASWKK